LIGVHIIFISDILTEEHYYEGYFCAPEEIGQKEITSKGLLIIRSELVAGDNTDIRLKVEFKGLISQKYLFGYFGKDNPFMIIKRKLKSTDDDEDGYLKVYESDPEEDNLSPVFKFPNLTKL